MYPKIYKYVDTFEQKVPRKIVQKGENNDPP
jgi:hypothetical protein